MTVHPDRIGKVPGRRQQLPWNDLTVSDGGAQSGCQAQIDGSLVGGKGQVEFSQTGRALFEKLSLQVRPGAQYTPAMRKPEFNEQNPAVIREILDTARYGHLATISPEGEPEVHPLNFAVVGDQVCFHGSSRGFLAARLGKPARFAVEDRTAWIPSHWRHPEMACPATTFYRSVQVRGRLEPVNRKAEVLAAFMARYQPEGGHLPLEDPRYAGPLQALTVAGINLEKVTCRVKMGQHLSPEMRRRVYDNLVIRGDRQCALEMARVDPTLSSGETEGDLVWTDDPRRVPVDQLHPMLDATYWAAGRPRHVVARDLMESALIVAALADDRLVAFARVSSPHDRIGFLFDVVVRQECRGRGVGARLLRRLLAHPRLNGALTRLFLETRDAMDFYARFGFVRARRSPRNGGTWLMVKERLEG